MMKKILWEDWKTIFHYTGVILYFFGFTLLVPVLLGTILREFHVVVDFLIGFFLFVFIGLALRMLFRARKDAIWLHGLCITALTWLLATLILAIPYSMGGFFGSYLDSCFDAMSGLTATGLTLIQRLDHAPLSLNVWRHVLSFIGGQGIIVIALVFLPPLGLGYKALVGEGKEDRLIPSIRETGKAIWVISLIYLGIGTLLFMGAGMVAGLSPLWSLFHGACMFMSSWSTGGFVPQTLSTLYYHHTLYDSVCMLVLILGSMNFGLHFLIWYKNKKELFRDVEIRTFLITIFIFSILLAIGLLQNNLFSEPLAMFRKGFFVFLSAHTSTGQATIYTTHLFNHWGDLALIVIMIAMFLGGSSGSTAGGFKIIRLAIIAKGFQHEIRRFFFPQQAVLVEKIHHIGDQVIIDKIVKSALIIMMLFIVMQIMGTVAGILNGYALVPSLFESISSSSNAGLSSGITRPDMPNNLKVVYIFNMWLGRLEFTAVFVFIIFVFRSFFKGK